MRELVAEEDQDMLALQQFLTGQQSRGIAQCLRASQDYQQLYAWLQAAGLDLQSIFQWLNTELGWGEYSPPGPAAPHRAARSMKSLWDQLVAIIPYSDYLAWFLQQENQQKWLRNTFFDFPFSPYLFVCAIVLIFQNTKLAHCHIWLFLSTRSIPTCRR